MHPKTLAAALALLPLAASAASDEDIRELRSQLKQLKEAYEKRIEALEARLVQAEASAGKAEQKAAEAAARPAAPATSFNPDVSLILQGAHTRQSRDPATWRIQGFVPAGEPEEVGPPRRRGFTLQETELVMSANVDPYFRGHMNLALTPENEVEVEEVWFQTLGLGQGLTLKGGRFLSGIGYHNEQHPHAWDFADAPLAYTAFFGNRLQAEGLQVKWLAPTELFLEFGAEAGRDDGFPGSSRNKKGSALGALFAHAGGDVGLSHSWRAGLSLVGTSPRERQFEDADAAGIGTVNAFSGRSRTAVADFVWKWAPQGDPRFTNFKLQGEYFRRKESGTLACDDLDAAAPSNCTGGLADSFRAVQSGYYLQGVYQFAPRWRVGYRYDRLDSGSLSLGAGLDPADLPVLAPHTPTRHTLMADYSPTEVSRLRLQFARDEVRLGQVDSQVWLQYIMSLGAHGAHKF